jgi:hypothetical protein
MLYFAYVSESQRSPKGSPTPYPLTGKRLSWELWEGSKYMNQLLTAAEPFILNGTRAQDIVVKRIDDRPDEPMQTLVLRNGNETLVILCNASEKSARIKIEGLSSWKKIKQMGTGEDKSEVKEGMLFIDLPSWSTQLLFHSKVN